MLFYNYLVLCYGAVNSDERFTSPLYDDSVLSSAKEAKDKKSSLCPSAHDDDDDAWLAFCVPFDFLGVNIFFAAERSFLPTLFVAGLLSLVLGFFLLDLRDGVSVEGVFAGDGASASFAGDGVDFVFFFLLQYNH